MPQLAVVTAFALVALLVGCSSSDEPTPPPTPTPTSTPTQPIATPTATQPAPAPDATPTPTPVPVDSLPDGPLLELSPGTGTQITSQAALVRGTVESGATVRVNGVETEVDPSGDFLVAVIVGPGENLIVVDVTGADGARVRRELRVVGS